MRVLVFTVRVALTTHLGHIAGSVGAAQRVEEGEPEGGVAGLVAIAIPDHGSEDHSNVHHA